MASGYRSLTSRYCRISAVGASAGRGRPASPTRAACYRPRALPARGTSATLWRRRASWRATSPLAAGARGGALLGGLALQARLELGLRLLAAHLHRIAVVVPSHARGHNRISVEGVKLRDRRTPPSARRPGRPHRRHDTHRRSGGYGHVHHGQRDGAATLGRSRDAGDLAGLGLGVGLQAIAGRDDRAACAVLDLQSRQPPVQVAAIADAYDGLLAQEAALAIVDRVAQADLHRGRIRR